MKTEELVTLLANNVQPVASGVSIRRHAVALGWGGAAAMVMLLLLLGVRADIAEAVRLPMFWVKLAFPVCIAIASFVAAVRLARPGMRLGQVPVAIVAPMAVMWLMAAYAILAVEPGGRLALLLGRTWAVCPFLIAMLSVPSFAGTFWAMRGLAPTRPGWAGAAAGLLSGSLATAVYALHCPEMAAPFLATWYLLGMLIPTAAGAALGPRLLRW